MKKLLLATVIGSVALLSGCSAPEKTTVLGPNLRKDPTLVATCVGIAAVVKVYNTNQFEATGNSDFKYSADRASDLVDKFMGAVKTIQNEKLLTNDKVGSLINDVTVGAQTVDWSLTEQGYGNCAILSVTDLSEK